MGCQLSDSQAKYVVQELVRNAASGAIFLPISSGVSARKFSEVIQRSFERILTQVPMTRADRVLEMATGTIDHRTLFGEYLSEGGEYHLIHSKERAQARLEEEALLWRCLKSYFYSSSDTNKPLDGFDLIVDLCSIALNSRPEKIGELQDILGFYKYNMLRKTALVVEVPVWEYIKTSHASLIHWKSDFRDGKSLGELESSDSFMHWVWSESGFISFLEEMGIGTEGVLQPIYLTECSMVPCSMPRFKLFKK